MLNPTLENYRHELKRHVQRLQALKEELQKRGVLDNYRGAFEKIEAEKDHLTARLSEAEHRSWDFIKAEFEGSWNSFIEDFELLKLRLPEVESAEEDKR